MNKFTFKKLSLVGALSLLLAACGGGSGGGDESGSTSKKDDLADVLDQTKPAPVQNGDLTAEIDAVNYDKIVQAAYLNIYDLLKTTHGMQRSNFFYWLKQTEKNGSQDLSQPIENVFGCTSGTSSATRTGFTNEGKKQTGTSMTFTTQDCVTPDAKITGSMTFTVKDNGQTESVYDISFTEDKETITIKGKDLSSWNDVVQDGKSHFRQTVAYNFENTVTKENNTKEKFTAEGKADFDTKVDDGEVIPQYLKIYENNKQLVQGYDKTVGLYTKEPLIYVQNGSDTTLQSGKLIVTTSNGKVEVNIENGQAAATTTVGDKTNNVVDKGDATKYLPTSN